MHFQRFFQKPEPRNVSRLTKKMETKITAPKMTYIGNLKITPPQLVGRRSFPFLGLQKDVQDSGVFPLQLPGSTTPPKKKQKTVNLEDAFPFPMGGICYFPREYLRKLPRKGLSISPCHISESRVAKPSTTRWAPDPGYKMEL